MNLLAPTSCALTFQKRVENSSAILYEPTQDGSLNILQRRFQQLGPSHPLQALDAWLRSSFHLQGSYELPAPLQPLFERFQKGMESFEASLSPFLKAFFNRIDQGEISEELQIDPITAHWLARVLKTTLTCQRLQSRLLSFQRKKGCTLPLEELLQLCAHSCKLYEAFSHQTNFCTLRAFLIDQRLSVTRALCLQILQGLGETLALEARAEPRVADGSSTGGGEPQAVGRLHQRVYQHYLQAQGLKALALQAFQSPDQLLDVLKSKGPLLAIGSLNPKAFRAIAKPHGRLGHYEAFYAAKTAVEKMSQDLAFALLVLGARKTADGEFVYFLDPLALASRVYVVAFDQFSQRTGSFYELSIA